MKPNNTIKLEKNIPIPGRGTSEFVATLKQMKVGDSFLYRKDQRALMSGYGKRLGIQLATRAVPGEPDKVRVWRTK